MIRYGVSFAFFAFICSVIYMADTGIPNVMMQVTAAVPMGDKLGHFGLFGTLALLLNWALRYRTFRAARRPWLWGSVLVLSFALLEEGSQAFFPQRTLDATDALADLLGVWAFSQLSWRMARQAGSVHHPRELELP
jgi:polysaccharide biosynthesis protein VpsQ